MLACVIFFICLSTDWITASVKTCREHPPSSQLSRRMVRLSCCRRCSGSSFLLMIEESIASKIKGNSSLLFSEFGCVVCSLSCELHMLWATSMRMVWWWLLLCCDWRLSDVFSCFLLWCQRRSSWLIREWTSADFGKGHPVYIPVRVGEHFANYRASSCWMVCWRTHELTKHETRNTRQATSKRRERNSNWTSHKLPYPRQPFRAKDEGTLHTVDSPCCEQGKKEMAVYNWESCWCCLAEGENCLVDNWNSVDMRRWFLRTLFLIIYSFPFWLRLLRTYGRLYSGVMGLFGAVSCRIVFSTAPFCVPSKRCRSSRSKFPSRLQDTVSWR